MIKRLLKFLFFVIFLILIFSIIIIYTAYELNQITQNGNRLYLFKSERGKRLSKITKYEWVDLKSKEKPKTVKQLVYMASIAHNVDEQLLTRIIFCESSNNVRAVNKNQFENSKGLVQINQLAHPEITDTQAFDPMFATNYLASNIAAGRGNMWYYCYNKAKNDI